MTMEHKRQDPVRQVTEAAATNNQEFGDFFLSRFLGLEISYNETDQSCTVHLPYANYLCNPQGSIHGGVITTAMDISMGHLCHKFLSTSMTIEMQLRFFKPLHSDAIFVGRLIRPGKRLVHLESRVTNDQGSLVAFGVGSWHRLDALK